LYQDNHALHQELDDRHTLYQAQVVNSSTQLHLQKLSMEQDVAIWAPHFILITAGEVLIHHLFPQKEKLPSSKWYEDRVANPIVQDLALKFDMDPLEFAREANNTIAKRNMAVHFATLAQPSPAKKRAMKRAKRSPGNGAAKDSRGGGQGDTVAHANRAAEDSRGGEAHRVANAKLLLSKYTFLTRRVSQFQVKELYTLG
jgi:hypothetical protein